MLLTTNEGFTQWSASPSINTPVCTSANEEVQPQCVGDGVGGVIIAWIDSGLNVRAQRLGLDGSPLWNGAGIRVNAQSAIIMDLKMMPDGLGGAIIVWTVPGLLGPPDSRVQRVNANGVLQWGSEVVFAGSNVGLVSDGAHGVLASYYWITGGGSGTRGLSVANVNSDGNLSWNTTLSSTGFPPLFDFGVPKIASDGTSGAIVVWSDTRSGSSDKNIYAQRIRWDGSLLWDSAGVPICVASDNQDYPAIASDGAGGAITSWIDYRNHVTNIYTQRVNATGTRLWTTNGKQISNLGGFPETELAMTSDMVGGAIMVWALHGDIVGQRVDTQGDTAWGPILPICTAPDIQQHPSVIIDNLGGVIVGWQDFRNGIDHDIYAQRISQSGIAAWDSLGLPVSIAGGHQRLPVLTANGIGGAIVVWQDHRGSNDDIYAQIVSSEGTLPIQLAQFSARSIGGNVVQLDWSTLSEVNNYGFEVQRSEDQFLNYTTVPNSFVPGHGTTNIPQHYTFDENNVPAGIWYYRLRQIDLDGTLHYSDGVQVEMLTDVAEVEVPFAFAMPQNYPNPFNPTTTINFDLPEASNVSLLIYDVLGRKVSTLVAGRQEAGHHHATWNATNVASGVYFARFTATDATGQVRYSKTNKLVLME